MNFECLLNFVSVFTITLEHGQVVRHLLLVQGIEGSNPSVPIFIRMGIKTLDLFVKINTEFDFKLNIVFLSILL